MATYKHIRSATANKRPTTSIADGQLAINTNTASPGLFFKDSAGTGIVKVGPVHVGTTAPNSTPAAGGSSGNYLGEQWLDTSVSPAQMKVWNGSAWVGVVADELPVSKLQDGTARQLIQTDAAGTGVEWTSNIDVPGTLDVTSTATFDSIARHPLGTAGAPTITFTGDTNTGIYSPGADQVAISTNGEGRLFVDSSGRVLLGTTTEGEATADDLTIASTGNTGITIRSGASNYGNIFFSDGTSGNDEFRGAIQYNHTDNFLKFDTNAGERLRITSTGELKHIGGGSEGSPGVYFAGSAPSNSLYVQATTGNVGLGTSSPDLTLSVNGAVNLRNSTRAGAFEITSGGDLWVGTATTLGKIYFETGHSTTGLPSTGTARMTVTSTGVGIGTTSPGYNLDVASATGEIDVAINSASGSDGRIRFAEAGTNKWTLVNQAASDSLALFDNTAGSQRLTVDSSGRLLVGTTSSFDTNATFQAVGGSHTAEFFKFGSDDCNVYIGSARGTQGSPTTLNNTDNLGTLSFRGHDGTSYVSGAYIRATVDGAPSSGDFPTRLVFSTTADGASSPTENMRIYSNRNVRFGTVGTSYGIFDINNDGSNTHKLDYISSGGSRLFAVQASDGTVVNSTGTYTTVSDVKLKENIVESPSQWQDIKALRVVKYNFKEETGYEQHTQLGLIAQEVEEVSPGLVFDIPDTDSDGVDLETVTKGVKQSIVYMKAVKALQEAMERIETLEQRLNDAGIA